jgi:flagellar biosynthesis/type III secretory pathway protein FliH
MILRGAVVSEKRFVLEELRQVAAPRSAGTLTPAGAPSGALSRGAGEAGAALGGNSSVVASPPPAPPAPLTLDKVLAWLDDCAPSDRAQLVQRLAGDIENQRQAAREAGMAAGHAEGLANATKQTQTALETLATLAARAETVLAAESTAFAEQCADIVCATLTKIAGPALTTRAAALGAVLEVLKRVKEGDELVIRVSAADVPALREVEDQIARALGDRAFTLTSDPRIEAGGCIVESALGSLDGRFDVQLRAVSETLRAAKSRVTSPS